MNDNLNQINPTDTSSDMEIIQKAIQGSREESISDNEETNVTNSSTDEGIEQIYTSE